MIYQEQIKKVLNNLSNIKEIKLEDCKIYNEYSVIVLRQNDSDVIICDNSEDANRIYNFLTEKFNKYKSRNNKSSVAEPTLEK